jgi:hypothetical protein
VSKVILDCEIYDLDLDSKSYFDRQLSSHNDNRDDIPVEVIQHIKGSPESITVVLVGKKRKYLDLPTWMTEQLPDPRLPRPSIRQYLRWRQSEQLIRSQSIEQLNIVEDPDNQIDRFLCHCFNDAYGCYGKQARNSNLELQLKVAKQWEKQNRYKPEINVAFAIMAILLLNQHDETKDKAYNLSQNLGQRALRSLHVEVLYQQWLSRKDNRQRTENLWQRLHQLETEEHLFVPLKDTSSDAIEKFCDAAKMRADKEKEILPIANSLSAALGNLSSPLELDSYAIITTKIIDLYLTFNYESKIRKLQEYQAIKLQKILDLIDRNRFDIVLLESLDYKKEALSNNSIKNDWFSNIFSRENEKMDRISHLIEQIDDLYCLTDQTISFRGIIEKIKDKCQHINQILGE